MADVYDHQHELQGIKQLLWGKKASPETFTRWCQGFIFSLSESTALEQRSGGPCAILAPMQAFMLKYILKANKANEFKKITDGEQKILLIRAMLDILSKCTEKGGNRKKYLIVYCLDGTKVVKNEDTVLKSETISASTSVAEKDTNTAISITIDSANEQDQSSGDLSIVSGTTNTSTSTTITTTVTSTAPVNEITIESASNLKSDTELMEVNSMESLTDDNSKVVNDAIATPVAVISNEGAVKEVKDELIHQENNSTSCRSDIFDTLPNSALRAGDFNVVSDFDKFHGNLLVAQFNDKDSVEQYLKLKISQLQGDYGVLIFLYSVLLTKGLVQLKTEISDLSEPLIHEIYGYGSQSLVNLMLTGRAVQHVWDNDQNIGGLTLKGIDEQSDIGFITLMEHMRYCTVGAFYKNPKFPIWIMGSETHLSVAFSFDQRLVAPEEPWEVAKREFRRYDPDGGFFIPFSLLPDVLERLGLVSDTEYIEIMRSKLDSENLGIVLLSNFLDEFFPDMRSSTPETFTIWHYNGLAGSHQNNLVQYVKGHAVLLECNLKSGSESDLVLTCLQTKWPNIEIHWETPSNRPPSLN